MNNIFNLIKCKSIKLIEPEVFVCTDFDDNKTLFLSTKEINKYIEDRTGVTLLTSKNLFTACKDAWKILIRENLNDGELGEKYCVTCDNKLLTTVNIDDENIDIIQHEIDVLNNICFNSSFVKKSDSGIELKINLSTKEMVENTSVFFDMIFNFDKLNYTAYSGYETVVSYNTFAFPAIPKVSKLFDLKCSLYELLTGQQISSMYDSIEYEYDMLKSSIEPEKLYMQCTADLILKKLKAAKINVKTDKKGMLCDIDEINNFFTNKIIDSVNSTNEKYKTLMKSKDIIIPEAHAFMTIELIAFITLAYYNGNYKVTINDLYEFTESLNEGNEPNLQSLEI